MLVLPLKTPYRFDIQRALAAWLDSNNSNGGGDALSQVGENFASQLQMSPPSTTTNNNDYGFDGPPPSMPQFKVPKPTFGSASCHSDLLRLQALRNCVCEAISKDQSHAAALDENGLDDCYEYHAALLEFEKRGFPVHDDGDGNGEKPTSDSNDNHAGLQLKWKGAFPSTVEHPPVGSTSFNTETHGSLTWERACVMFDTVSLLTFSAAQCSVTERSECKAAVGYCQQAASIVAVLKELVKKKPSSGANNDDGAAGGSSIEYATVDLSQAMLLFWEKLLVAQAQLSIYRMAALANNDTQHSTLSFLSQSAYQLFSDALKAAQDPRLVSEVPDASHCWGTYCKAASILAAAKAEYHQAVVHRLTKSEWGLEIARLRSCLAKLESGRDFCKNATASSGGGGGGGSDGNSSASISYAERECTTILPVVVDRLNEVVRDNHHIYQDEIPKALPEITAKQLAKSDQGLPEAMIIPKKALFLHL